VTTLQFEQDGDVVTADGDGFITIYSVDSDGAYFVRMEFEVTFIELFIKHPFGE
jgi:microtubule-associated protein-like 1/2